MNVSAEEIVCEKKEGTQERSRAPEESRTPTARQLYLSPPAPDEARQEVLERNFFSNIRLRNGTYKYTYSRRLDDVNESVNDLLPAARPLRVMDVAVSSGISTLEWIERLERAGIEHLMVAGDLSVNARLLSLARGLHVLVDSGGYPLQYEINGRAIPHPPGRVNRLKYFLPFARLRRALANFDKSHASCSSAATGPQADQVGVACQPIALVSPRLRRPANLEVIEDDILEELNPAREFHVLRAANILNRAYFDETTLRRMISNLRRRLLGDALLIVCRTNSEGVNNGTIFSLSGAGKFTVVRRIGDGSEIEDLVLATLPPSSDA